MDTTYNYRITLYAKATLTNSNKTLVYTDSDSPWELLKQIHDDWQPSDTEETVRYNLTRPLKTPNILAASRRSLMNKRAGLSSEVFNFFHEPCGVSGSCLSKSAGGVKLSNWGRLRKFIISHEIGHYILWKITDLATWRNDCSSFLVSGPCEGDSGSSHDWNSREFQSCAAMEGLADFYSAAVWNNSTHNDCDYYEYDCATDGAFLEKNNCTPYTQATDSWGTESDWASFWWDMHSEEGLSVQDVMEIYDDANPSISNWVYEFTVYNKLRDAADDNGVDMDDWDDWADYRLHHLYANGIDH